jgi:hypothetical protein
MNVDEGYEALKSLLPEIEEALRKGATEQDTRLQVIDRILTTVLGWPHNRIRTEVNADSRFADYGLVDAAERYIAVLEAKKTGILTVDTASKTKTDVRVGGRVLKGSMDGITQAMDSARI